MENRRFKIILIGDPNVGKTTIRRSYIGEGFKANYMMTIGADFAAKKIEVDNISIVLQIWDLSGQKNFQAVRKMYYDNTSAIVVVYDMTHLPTLNNIPRWINEYKGSNGHYPVPIAIVGNKSDMLDPNEAQRLFTEQTSSLYDAIDTTVLFYPTSAKTGENIDALFTSLTRKTLDFET